ncbi:MAG: hypothetical protein KIT72_06015 [Polyangiaceae bacterium]|nr:hypothetical protein [Polyangiaceae bacterium]MCW5789956.1 hypothetical protein [Polyangiaceae bacterium]
MREGYPWHAWLLLVRPDRVAQSLERVAAAGLVPVTPNLWQIELGVLSMWHRVLFRSETVGNAKVAPVRPGWRARLLKLRPLRFGPLLWERAVAPLDFSGLTSSPERITSHLLGAHHDGSQFAYDLELLGLYPGGLERALELARAVTQGTSKRGEWLRDLVVYQGYHERLEAALLAALSGDLGLTPNEARDPDIAFGAYLRWCAAQPRTPGETLSAWQRGELALWRRTGEQVS